MSYHLPFRLSLLGLLLAAPCTAFCQALPSPAPSNVFSTAESALQSGLSRLGFAANDPRVGPTVSDADAAISAAETSSANSISLADLATSALTTSEALDVSAFLGPEAFALTAAGIGVYSAASLLIPPAPSVAVAAFDSSAVYPSASIETAYPPVTQDAPSSSSSAPASSSSAPSSSASQPSAPPKVYPFPPLPTNAILFPFSMGTVPFTFFTSPYGDTSDVQEIVAEFLADVSGASVSSVDFSSSTGTYEVTTVPSGYSFEISPVTMPYDLPIASTQLTATDLPDSTDYYFICQSGFIAIGPSCQPAPSVTSPVPITYDVEDLPAATPQPVLDAPLNPAIIAAIANAAWQKAASAPGYEGVPFSLTQPVTVADVEAAEAADPATSPLVQDFVTPEPVSQLAPPSPASSSPSAASAPSLLISAQS